MTTQPDNSKPVPQAGRKADTIHAYLRKELLSPLGARVFGAEAVAAEIARRDDLARKAADRLRYPHLSHS